MRVRFEQVTFSCLRCLFCHAYFLHALILAALGYSLLSFRSDSCALQGFQVQFLSDDDVAEDGIDGGGLFKEFLTLLLRELMNMDRCCSRSLSELRFLTPCTEATSPRHPPISSGLILRRSSFTVQAFFVT